MCYQIVVLFPSLGRNFCLYFAFAAFFQTHLNINAHFWWTFIHFTYYWEVQLFFLWSIQFHIFFFLCVCVCLFFCPVQTGQLLFLYFHLPVLFILVNWPAAVWHALASWNKTICMATIISSITKLIDLEQQCTWPITFYCLYNKSKIPICWKELIPCFPHLHRVDKNPRCLRNHNISIHILLTDGSTLWIANIVQLFLSCFLQNEIYCCWKIKLCHLIKTAGRKLKELCIN